jgi:CDP-glucose 4,6-dehydratase
MAAQALVRASYANPIETFATNLMGTVHLLDAMRITPSVKAVLIVTTDKVYENMDWAWGYREGDRLGGFDPYSASKACAELATAAFRNSYFHHANTENHPPFIATARAGNVIGGGDYAQDRLIPDFYRALSRGEAVHIRNPLATRPWQHVLEPLRGYLLYLESMMAQNRGKPSTALPTALNFGPNLRDAWRVSRVADRVCDIWGGNARWVQDPAIHPHEAHALCLDHSLAARTLHWHPVLSTGEALEDTVHWYKRTANGESASALMHEQIDHYEKRIPARNISKH